MKNIYFVSILVLTLIISSGFAMAATQPTKPKNLDCKLTKNFDNEWCDMEKKYSVIDPLDINYCGVGSCSPEEEMDMPLACDPFFVVIPKYKSYTSKYIPDTKILQEILNSDNEKAVLKVDGLWGSKTDKEFRAFQKRNEIKVTGLVDKATLEFLQENYCEEEIG